MHTQCEDKSQQKSEFVPKKAPVAGVAGVIAGWLAFILIYALDWSRGFDLFQNVIVTIVSLAIAIFLIGGVMLSWYHVNGELRRK